MYESGSPFFAETTWLAESELSQSLRDDIAYLCLSPLEVIEHLFRRPEDAAASSLIRVWSRGESKKGWLEATVPDRSFWSAWLSGLDLRDMHVVGLPNTYGRAGTIERRLALNEYLEQRKNFALWMLSAAVRVTEYTMRGRDARLIGLRRVLALMEWGVPTWNAVRLTRIGLWRTVATKIERSISQIAESDDDEAAIRETLLELSEAMLRRMGCDDDEVAHVRKVAAGQR